jgi:cation transport ATPase
MSLREFRRCGSLLVVFDKTCTLTEGLMSLSDVVADEDEARFLT